MTSRNSSRGHQTSRRGKRKEKPVFVGDFETVTDPTDCRVWSWGLIPVNTEDSFQWGIDIESFIDLISEHDCIIYFHNLKFDAGFIVDWLLNNGFVFREDVKQLRPLEFTGIITDMNKFYSIKVCWGTGHTTEFRDSLKKLPMPVSIIAKAFNLPMGKGEIDYHKPRKIGYLPTVEELDYLERDVTIVALALRQVFASGMTRLTVASDSLAEYKRLNGAQWFDRTFPTFSDEMDTEIRRAYRGGFTYVAERFKDKRLPAGLVLDVNSLYPSVMYNERLPYGEPVFADGLVLPTIEHPCTIFSVTFTARLKPEHIPCIQIKGSSIFGGTEYLTVIDEPVTLMFTNVDWQLYQDHYDIDVLSYNGGWKFKAVRGLFDSYIDKWSAVKINSEGGAREIAKLHLNSLYGKFASNPNVTGKIPVLEDNVVRLRRGKDKRKAPIYTAVGVFVTSYARDLTIRAAQANYDVFVYADTDSLHLLLDTVPETIDVDKTRMGAWKLEYRFTEAHYLRAKSYLCLKADGTYKSAFAGVPAHVQAALTFDDIVGDTFTLSGKLEHHVVPGGVVLRDKPYTFKRVA